MRGIDSACPRNCYDSTISNVLSNEYLLQDILQGKEVALSNSARAQERRRKRTRTSKHMRSHRERSKSFMGSNKKMEDRQHTKDVALADALGLIAKPASPARRAFQDG